MTTVKDYLVNHIGMDQSSLESDLQHLMQEPVFYFFLKGDIITIGHEIDSPISDFIDEIELCAGIINDKIIVLSPKGRFKSHKEKRPIKHEVFEPGDHAWFYDSYDHLDEMVQKIAESIWSKRVDAYQNGIGSTSNIWSTARVDINDSHFDEDDVSNLEYAFNHYVVDETLETFSEDFFESILCDRYFWASRDKVDDFEELIKEEYRDRVSESGVPNFILEYVDDEVNQLLKSWHTPDGQLIEPSLIGPIAKVGDQLTFLEV